MLAHKLSTTSCGTSVRVKWPNKEEYEWLCRDGKKRLFSAKRPIKRDGIEDLSTAKSSEQVALEFLVREYEKFFTIHTERWQEQNSQLAIKNQNPMALVQQTFGDNSNLYVKGGKTVKTAIVNRKKRFNRG